jgi:hypothetical protein
MEPREEPTASSGDDRICYVEELEGPDDYWLSITDAARVCRIQDVSIRRAITAGRLPVRRMPAGDNRRTRFVRASDLPRANYPILDSGAAITSEIRKVDILNIPLQQQRMTDRLDALVPVIDEVAEELAQLRAHVREEEIEAARRLVVVMEELAAIQREQTTQAERYGQDQKTAQGQTERINARVDGLTSEQEGITARLDALVTDSEERQEHLTSRISKLEDEMQRTKKDIQAQREQLQRSMQAQMETALFEQKAKMQAEIEQQARDFNHVIQRTEQAVARDVAELTAKQEGQTRELEGTATRAEAAMTGAIATQRRLDAIQAEYEKQIQVEREARTSLMERITRLEAQPEPEKKPATSRSRKKKEQTGESA